MYAYREGYMPTNKDNISIHALEYYLYMYAYREGYMPTNKDNISIHALMPRILKENLIKCCLYVHAI